MNKKGLSDVVTTTLIILVAIIAVGLLWSVVRSSLQKTSEGIDTSCISLEVAPVSCVNETADGNNVSVKYQWARGEVNLASAKFVFALDNGESFVYETTSLPSTVLDTKEVTMIKLPVGRKASSVKVAGVVETSAGKKNTCDLSTVQVPC